MNIASPSPSLLSPVASPGVVVVPAIFTTTGGDNVDVCPAVTVTLGTVTALNNGPDIRSIPCPVDGDECGAEGRGDAIPSSSFLRCPACKADRRAT
jgi:hypothetical protein